MPATTANIPRWRKTKIALMVIGAGLLLLTCLIIFEEQLFFKSDAKDLLSAQNIVLVDDFQIIENKSMWGAGDYYHTFNLRVSPEDKRAVIEKIIHTDNFKKQGEFIDLIESPNRYEGKVKTQNYEDSLRFIRELFRPNGQG